MPPFRKMRRRYYAAMGGWNAAIDVSNVCWDAQLPPEKHGRPIWSRLQLIEQAWRRQYGRNVLFRRVADDSLVHSLDDMREHGRLEASGELTVAPIADVEILALACDHDLHVITRDHFVDYRRAHPWIENSPHRFHRWEAQGGRVRIVPLGIISRSEAEVSWAGEFKELKRHQLDPRILDTVTSFRGAGGASTRCAGSPRITKGNCWSCRSWPGRTQVTDGHAPAPAGQGRAVPGVAMPARMRSTSCSVRVSSMGSRVSSSRT